MSSREPIDVSRTFFKVKARELLEAEVGENYVIIVNGSTSFKVRRVRIVGRVAEIRLGNRWADCVLADETGEVLVRAWDEKKELIEPLSVNDLIDVFARVRVFEGKVYLSPEIVAVVDEDCFRRRNEEIRKIRDYIRNRFIAVGENNSKDE